MYPYSYSKARTVVPRHGFVGKAVLRHLCSVVYPEGQRPIVCNFDRFAQSKTNSITGYSINIDGRFWIDRVQKENRLIVPCSHWYCLGKILVGAKQ